jgi:glycosyltransferase involved in cell wall biosynthesis
MTDFARHEVVLDLRNPTSSTSDVTVIVTLYNYANYIEQALQSVLEQTHRRLNLVVVNDKSSDMSLRIARDWMTMHASRFGQAMLLSAVSNYGLAVSRNVAFRDSNTEHVLVLDADNALYPLAIERLLSACNNAKAQAAYSLIETFGEAAGIGESYVWDPNRFARHNYVDAMALIRKDAWEKAGGYTLFSTSGWEDYDLWCSFIDAGMEAVFVPQILSRYRVHGKSMLRQETNKEEEGARLEMIVRHPWLKL